MTNLCRKCILEGWATLCFASLRIRDCDWHMIGKNSWRAPWLRSLAVEAEAGSLIPPLCASLAGAQLDDPKGSLSALQF